MMVDEDCEVVDNDLADIIQDRLVTAVQNTEQVFLYAFTLFFHVFSGHVRLPFIKGSRRILSSSLIPMSVG